MVKRTLKAIWKEFIYGGHLQSLGAASIVFVSGILLKIDITWDILFVTYLTFYPLYLYNRFKEIKIDYLTNPQRTEHLKVYINQTPLILLLVILVLIGALIYFSNIWALIFSLLLVFFGLLYTTTFKNFTKKIPLFKNFYVAISFALLVFFPVIYYSYPLTNILIFGLLIFGVFVYLKAFMMQILLDLKDIASDKKERLLTLPVIFGEKKTFNILKIISLLATVFILLIFSLYFNIFPKPMLMLFLTTPFNFYCFKLVRQKKYFSYILVSGEFILWLILILIGKIIL